jgi:hypothetical protein
MLENWNLPSLEDNGIPQRPDATDLHLDLISMLQEGRRVHEASHAAWCAGHKHRPNES